MFIVWGRKITRRPAGFVADYCGICREPKRFRLSRLGSVGHVYYISVGEGKLVGYERTCMSCGTFSPAAVSDYRKIAKTALPLETLKQETCPGLDAAMAERRALDERVKTAPHLLSPNERLGLIRSPFNLLSPKVEKRFASTNLDGGVVGAIAGAIGLMIVCPAVGAAISTEGAGPAMVIGMGLGLALIIWQFIAAGQRFMRKEILPPLAKALAPLKPSEAEIEQALRDFRKAGHKIGGKLKAAEILQSAR
ncbi:hypothetical protein [Pseudoduganella violaceinigra]|uniref:hypothetical protein n=1 Tax=Pseudoduganella violaceinigra TaxID=246602 RepID=UPI0004228C21|nr:hypothetical protein [Pseudoduganella violaceinigra]